MLKTVFSKSKTAFSTSKTAFSTSKTSFSTLKTSFRKRFFNHIDFLIDVWGYHSFLSVPPMSVIKVILVPILIARSSLLIWVKMCKIKVFGAKNNNNGGAFFGVLGLGHEWTSYPGRDTMLVFFGHSMGDLLLEAMQHMDEFNAQELTNAAWAFATASQTDRLLFSVLARAAK